MTRPEGGRRLLYVDLAYTVDEVRRRHHEQFFEARHSGGFFEYVWGLHPLADRVSDGPKRRIEEIPFSDRQTIIEGAAELYALPKLMLPLNFVASQLKLLRRAVKLVKTQGIALVTVTDPLYGGLFGWAVARLCKIPFAIHVVAHYDEIYALTRTPTMPKLIPSRTVERHLIKFLLSRADLVAPGTETLAEYVIANGTAPNRTAVFRVSKNMSALHRRPPNERPSATEAFARLGISAKGPYLLSIARLQPVKLVDHAIRAMKPVLDEFPEAVGLIAGDGDMRAELESLAQSLRIEDRVHFLGVVDQQTLSEIIPVSIAVSPMTGMALFETSMGGSPAVAYRYDEIIHKLVVDHVSGFLVEHGDYEALGERLLEIARDDAMRAEMSRNIREIASRYSDPDRLYEFEARVFEATFKRFERERTGRNSPSDEEVRDWESEAA